MAHTEMMNIALNRVEGDLEVRVGIEDGVVTDAWSSGIMYRGFERILIGRAALDALVITPRICGICSTAQLAAACQALEMIAQVEPAPSAVLLRNVLLMTEQLQSDMRHTFLMFCPDFANPIYSNHPLFQEAVNRYEPLRGKAALETIQETRKVLEIVALIGGQWPHSSYMVPGGITSVPGKSDLMQCRLLLSRFRKWYEARVLGCDLDRWSEVKSASDLDAWLEEKASQRESELGFYLRFARSIGLPSLGRGHSNFVSYGS
ncbi:MAG: nickel-dependent hydrogenase large subunit, partial [Desulforhabdus sp.]|nr:nickel-dependent hydrogenase large subunit [Desulforhabdus sp.]